MPEKIQIEYAAISSLRPWPDNPRIITDEQLTALVKSIEKFGLVDPVIVNQDGLVIGGHQRVKAAEKLGISEVPVVRVSVTGTDMKALNLALNKISGDWDEQKLAPLLSELGELPEFDLTGFSKDELSQALAITQAEEYDKSQEDTVPSTSAKPRTKQGDLWQLGQHRLLCGDATESETWKQLLDKERCALCITDPPYGVNYQQSKKLGYKGTGFKDWKKWVRGDETTDVAIKALSNIFANLLENGVAYIFCGSRLLIEIGQWLINKQIHFSSHIVWIKSEPMLSWERYHAAHENIIHCGPGTVPTGKKARWYGPKNESTVWDIPIERPYVHPTQKPVAVYERAIRNSTKPGESMVDPFLGSGTAFIAAEKLSRRCYGMEVDPAYVDVAVKRWEDYTGKKACVVSRGN